MLSAGDFPEGVSSGPVELPPAEMGQLSALAKGDISHRISRPSNVLLASCWALSMRNKSLSQPRLSWAAAHHEYEWQCLHRQDAGWAGFEGVDCHTVGVNLESRCLLQVLAELSPFQRERAAAQMLQAGIRQVVA